jgi:hypothetical protein
VKAAVLDPQSPGMEPVIRRSPRPTRRQPEQVVQDTRPATFRRLDGGPCAHSRGRTGHLPHARTSYAVECGMAYGARALGLRSARSSRGCHDPPRRSGKPTTGRRGTGVRGRRRGRRASCTWPQLFDGHSGVPLSVGPWRAGCVERRLPGSGRGRRKRTASAVPRRRPTLLEAAVQRLGGAVHRRLGQRGARQGRPRPEDGREVATRGRVRSC